MHIGGGKAHRAAPSVTVLDTHFHRPGMASRHTQYEMFYAGAGFVTRGHRFPSYDWGSTTAMVDELLASYPGPGANGLAKDIA